MSNIEIKNLVPHSKTYQICFCGFPQNKHNFKHLYKPIELEYFEKLIYLENENLQYITKEICNVEQCNLNKYLHTGLANHTFISKEIKCVKVNYSIPEDMKCNLCDSNISDHYEKINTHKPQIKIILDFEKTKNDEIDFFILSNRKKVDCIFERRKNKLDYF